MATSFSDGNDEKSTGQDKEKMDRRDDGIMTTITTTTTAKQTTTTTTKMTQLRTGPWQVDWKRPIWHSTCVLPRRSAFQLQSQQGSDKEAKKPSEEAKIAAGQERSKNKKPHATTTKATATATAATAQSSVLNGCALAHAVAMVTPAEVEAWKAKQLYRSSHDHATLSATKRRSTLLTSVLEQERPTKPFASHPNHRQRGDDSSSGSSDNGSDDGDDGNNDRKSYSSSPHVHPSRLHLEPSQSHSTFLLSVTLVQSAATTTPTRHEDDLSPMSTPAARLSAISRTPTADLVQLDLLEKIQQETTTTPSPRTAAGERAHAAATAPTTTGTSISKSPRDSPGGYPRNHDADNDDDDNDPNQHYHQSKMLPTQSEIRCLYSRVLRWPASAFDSHEPSWQETTPTRERGVASDDAQVVSIPPTGATDEEQQEGVNIQLPSWLPASIANHPAMRFVTALVQNKHDAADGTHRRAGGPLEQFGCPGFLPMTPFGSTTVPVLQDADEEESQAHLDEARAFDTYYNNRKQTRNPRQPPNRLLDDKKNGLVSACLCRLPPSSPSTAATQSTSITSRLHGPALDAVADDARRMLQLLALDGGAGNEFDEPYEGYVKGPTPRRPSQAISRGPDGNSSHYRNSMDEDDGDEDEQDNGNAVQHQDDSRDSPTTTDLMLACVSERGKVYFYSPWDLLMAVSTQRQQQSPPPPPNQTAKTVIKKSVRRLGKATSAAANEPTSTAPLSWFAAPLGTGVPDLALVERDWEHGMATLLFGSKLLASVQETILPLSQPLKKIQLSLPHMLYHQQQQRQRKTPGSYPWSGLTTNASWNYHMEEASITSGGSAGRDRVGGGNSLAWSQSGASSDQDHDQHENDNVGFVWSAFDTSLWDPTVDPATLPFQTRSNRVTHCVAAMEYLCIAGCGRSLRDRRRHQRHRAPQTRRALMTQQHELVSRRQLGSNPSPQGISTATIRAATLPGGGLPTPTSFDRTMDDAASGGTSAWWDIDPSHAPTAGGSAPAESSGHGPVSGRAKQQEFAWEEEEGEDGGFVIFISLQTFTTTRTMYVPFVPCHVSPIVWGSMSFVLVVGATQAIAIRMDATPLTSITRGLAPPTLNPDGTLSSPSRPTSAALCMVHDRHKIHPNAMTDSGHNDAVAATATDPSHASIPASPTTEGMTMAANAAAEALAEIPVRRFQLMPIALPDLSGRYHTVSARMTRGVTNFARRGEDDNDGDSDKMQDEIDEEEDAFETVPLIPRMVSSSYATFPPSLVVVYHDEDRGQLIVMQHVLSGIDRLGMTAVGGTTAATASRGNSSHSKANLEVPTELQYPSLQVYQKLMPHQGLKRQITCVTTLQAVGQHVATIDLPILAHAPLPSPISGRLQLGHDEHSPQPWCFASQGWCLVGIGAHAYFICWEGANAERGAFVRALTVESDSNALAASTALFSQSLVSTIVPVNPFVATADPHIDGDVRMLPFAEPFIKSSPLATSAIASAVSAEFTTRNSFIGTGLGAPPELDDLVVEAMRSISNLSYRETISDVSPPRSLLRKSRTFSHREKSVRLLRQCSSWTQLEHAGHINLRLDLQVPTVSIRLADAKAGGQCFLSLRKTAVDNGAGAPFQHILSWLSDQEDYFTAASLALDLLRDAQSLRQLWRSFDRIDDDDERSKLEGLLDGIISIHSDDKGNSSAVQSTLTQLADMTIGCLTKGGFAMSSTLEYFLEHDPHYDASRASLMLVAAAASGVSDDVELVATVMGKEYKKDTDHGENILWPVRCLLKAAVARDNLIAAVLLLNATLPDELRRRPRADVAAASPPSMELCKALVSLIVASSPEAAEVLLSLHDEVSRQPFWFSLQHETRLELSLLCIEGLFPMFRQPEVRGWAIQELQKCLESESSRAINIYDLMPSPWLQATSVACLTNAGCNWHDLAEEEDYNDGSSANQVISVDDLEELEQLLKDVIRARNALAPAPGFGGLDFDLLIPSLLILEERDTLWCETSRTSTRFLLNAACYLVGRRTSEEPMFVMNSSTLMRQCFLAGNMEAGANLIGGKNGLILECAYLLKEELSVSIEVAESFLRLEPMPNLGVAVASPKKKSATTSFVLRPSLGRILCLLREHVLSIRTYGEFESNSSNIRGKVDPVLAARVCLRTWWSLTRGDLVMESTRWLESWLRQEIALPAGSNKGNNSDVGSPSPYRLVCAALLRALIWATNNSSNHITTKGMSSGSRERVLASRLHMSSHFLVQLAQSCCGVVQALPDFIAQGDMIRQWMTDGGIGDGQHPLPGAWSSTSGAASVISASSSFSITASPRQQQSLITGTPRQRQRLQHGSPPTRSSAISVNDSSTVSSLG